MTAARTRLSGCPRCWHAQRAGAGRRFDHWIQVRFGSHRAVWQGEGRAMMNQGAVWALAVVVLINTAFITGIAVALLLLNRKLGEMTESVHPLIERANSSLSRVET